MPLSDAAIRFALVGLGALTGAMLRYGIQCYGAAPPHSFYNTLAVNLIGCFLIGVAYNVLGRYASPAWSLLLITGLLGGFTTYSAFALDFVNLWREGHNAMALAYWAVTSFMAPVCCAAGYFITHKLTQ